MSTEGQDSDKPIDHITYLKNHLKADTLNNILYCHLSSNEVTSKLAIPDNAIQNELSSDLVNQIFTTDQKFKIGYDGRIFTSPNPQSSKTQFMSKLAKNTSVTMSKLKRGELFNSTTYSEKS